MKNKTHTIKSQRILKYILLLSIFSTTSFYVIQEVPTTNAQDYVIAYEDQMFESGGSGLYSGYTEVWWRIRLSKSIASVGETIIIYVDFKEETHYSGPEPYIQQEVEPILISVDTGGLTSMPLTKSFSFPETIGLFVGQPIPFDFYGEGSVQIPFEIPENSIEGSYALQAYWERDLRDIGFQPSNALQLEIFETPRTDDDQLNEDSEISNTFNPFSGLSSTQKIIAGVTLVAGTVAVIFVGYGLTWGWTQLGGKIIRDSMRLWNRFHAPKITKRPGGITRIEYPDGSTTHTAQFKSDNLFPHAEKHFRMDNIVPPAEKYKIAKELARKSTHSKYLLKWIKQNRTNPEMLDKLQDFMEALGE